MLASSRCLVLVLFAMTLFAPAPLRSADLTAIDRNIGKQPAYRTEPRYCLLLFGPEAKTRVWIVEDGRTLYVDRNANGDLTDDGPPLQPSEVRESPHASRRPAALGLRLRPRRDQTSRRARHGTELPHWRTWNYGDPEDEAMACR